MLDEKNVFSGITISRKNFVELLIVAVLLSFGINVIASQFLNWLKDQSVIAFIIGTILCILPILYALINLFGKRKNRTTVNGFVVYDPTKKKLVSIPRYHFAQRICNYIDAAFSENIALKMRWDKQPLMPYKIINQETESSKERTETEGFTGKVFIPFGQKITAEENATVKLLCEASEYFLIELLSFHLDRYFYNDALNKKRLTFFKREDIPSVLLSNTFLELFTRPKADRPIFVQSVDENSDESEVEEQAYAAAISIGGGTKADSVDYIYNKFQMVLPKGSKVKRLPDHKIIIETKKLKMILAVKYETCLLAPDLLFSYYYLGNRDLLERYFYEIQIDMQISVKWHALLSSTGWEYYRWVDSFFNKIEKMVSKTAFFDSIHWENSLTYLLCQEQIKRYSEEDQSL